MHGLQWSLVHYTVGHCTLLCTKANIKNHDSSKQIPIQRNAPIPVLPMQIAT